MKITEKFKRWFNTSPSVVELLGIISPSHWERDFILKIAWRAYKRGRKEARKAVLEELGIH